VASTESSTPPTWRDRLRAAFAGGTDARSLAAAAALGGALAVAPLPGLQMVLGAALALRWRLNVGIVLVISNLSFGPLLAFWWALAVALGRSLLRGEVLAEVFANLHARFAAAEGLRAILVICGEVLVDWLVGCGLLMGGLALVLGGLAYAGARLLRRPH